MGTGEFIAGGGGGGGWGLVCGKNTSYCLILQKPG